MRKIPLRKMRTPLSDIYDEAGLPEVIRRSLNLMLLGNLFGNLYGIICGGGTTAMNGLATQMHAGDFAYGVLNGIPQAAALLQIPFSMLVNRTHHRKKYLLTFGLFSRFLWILFGLIPLVIPDQPPGAQLWTLIVLLTISSCCSASINVCWFPWFSDLAPIQIRGRWFSFRDTILAFCNLLFGILTARLMDTLPPDTRYAVIFALGGIIGMADMICFGFCKETYSAPPQKLPLLKIFRDVKNNRPFMHFTLMWTGWCLTAALCEPYLTRYSMNEMSLSFTQMMVFGSAASAIATIFMMRIWGRALDQYGCRSVMLVAAVVAAVSNGFYLFSTPGNVWPVFLRNFIGAAFWSGSNLAANSMQLTTSPDDTRPSYIAVFSCCTAIAGTTLGTLIGGILLEWWEKLGLFQGWMDRYKVLILLACVLRLALALLLVPKLNNDRDGTARELLKDWMTSGKRRLYGLVHMVRGKRKV